MAGALCKARAAETRLETSGAARKNAPYAAAWRNTPPNADLLARSAARALARRSATSSRVDLETIFKRKIQLRNESISNPNDEDPSACEVTRTGLLYYPTSYEGLEQSKNVIYTGQEATQQIIAGLDWLNKEKKAKTFFLNRVALAY